MLNIFYTVHIQNEHLQGIWQVYNVKRPKVCALDVEQLWFKTRVCTYVAECSDYPKLAKFPGPVQSLIVDQFKIPRKGDMAEIPAPLHLYYAM